MIQQLRFLRDADYRLTLKCWSFCDGAILPRVKLQANIQAEEGPGRISFNPDVHNQFNLTVHSTAE